MATLDELAQAYVGIAPRTQPTLSGPVVTPALAAQIQALVDQYAMMGRPAPLEVPEVGTDATEYLTNLYYRDAGLATQLAEGAGIDRAAFLDNVRQVDQAAQANRGGGVFQDIGNLTRVGKGEVTGPADFFRDAALLGAIGYGTSFLGGGAPATQTGTATVSASDAAAGVAADGLAPITLSSSVAPIASPIGAPWAAPAAAASSAPAGAAFGPLAAAGGAIAPASGGVAATMPSWVNWANLGSTVLGLYGADRAADAQVAGSQAAIDESRRQFDTTRGDFMPAIELLGQSAGQLKKLNSGDMTPFVQSPDYQFNLAEGQRAIDRSLAARGKALSGAGVREGVRYASGLASNQYGSFYDRLLASAGLGTTGAAASANAGANSAAMVGNAAQNAGNARASGYANQYGALQGGLQNVLLQRYLGV